MATKKPKPKRKARTWFVVDRNWDPRLAYSTKKYAEEVMRLYDKGTAEVVRVREVLP